MTDRPAFFDYARDFEIALLTDDWARVARHFAPDAVHTVAGEGVFDQDDRGRDAVIAGLRRSVAALDRRFAVRVPEVLAGPLRRDDGGLWMHWRMTFRHAGPARARGRGRARRALRRRRDRAHRRAPPRRQRRARERVPRASTTRRCAPPRAAPAPLDADAARRFRRATLRTFVRAYAAAKSQADAAGALALCAPDFSIETIPFGIASKRPRRDREAPRALLRRLPRLPRGDRGPGRRGRPGRVVGPRSRSPRSGPFLGQPPTGKRAELPAFSVFDFRGGELVRERFHFDLPDVLPAARAPAGARSRQASRSEQALERRDHVAQVAKGS